MREPHLTCTTNILACMRWIPRATDMAQPQPCELGRTVSPRQDTGSGRHPPRCDGSPRDTHVHKAEFWHTSWHVLDEPQLEMQQRHMHKPSRLEQTTVIPMTTMKITVIPRTTMTTTVIPMTTMTTTVIPMTTVTTTVIPTTQLRTHGRLREVPQERRELSTDHGRIHEWIGTKYKSRQPKIHHGRQTQRHRIGNSSNANSLDTETTRHRALHYR